MNVLICIWVCASHVHIFLLRQTGSVSKSEKAVLMGHTTRQDRLSARTKQYKKWQYSAAHSLECTRSRLDGTSQFCSSGVECGRETLLCLTQTHLFVFGTLVKTIPWKHNGNPWQLWYYGCGERTDQPKGLRKWMIGGGACRKCVGTLLKQQEAK